MPRWTCGCRARRLSATVALGALLTAQAASSAASRLHTGQVVVSDFAQSGLALHAVGGAHVGSLKNVTIVDMQRRQVARLGFDSIAYIFPTIARAKTFLRLLGDVHSVSGGFGRSVDNVVVLIYPWTNSKLRAVPRSVENALARLRAD